MAVLHRTRRSCFLCSRSWCRVHPREGGRGSWASPSSLCAPLLQTLTFACDVREEQSQTILLSNPSSEAWTVQPIVKGKHWKGPELFHLEANEQKKPYKIIYKPLTMSSKDKKHQVGELCQRADLLSMTLTAHPAVGRSLAKVAFRGPVQAETLPDRCWVCWCLEARHRERAGGKAGLTRERAGQTRDKLLRESNQTGSGVLEPLGSSSLSSRPHTMAEWRPEPSGLVVQAAQQFRALQGHRCSVSLERRALREEPGSFQPLWRQRRCHRAGDCAPLAPNGSPDCEPSPGCCDPAVLGPGCSPGADVGASPSTARTVSPSYRGCPAEPRAGS